MIEIISNTGKKLGVISDDANIEDKLLVNGKEISLSDAYNDEEVRLKFNKQLKGKKDDSDNENG